MGPTLLFDLDGTIVETDHLHFEAFKGVFMPHGVTLDWDAFKAGIIGKNNPVIAATFLPHLPVDRHPAVMETKEAAFRDLIGSLEACPGLLPMLDWADQEGIACGVVTNAPRLNADRVLEVLDLRHRFKVLVIGPELREAKPHPLPYVTAMELLGGDPARSVAFEDSPSGVRSAAAANVGVVGLLTSFDHATLRGAGADVSGPDFADPSVVAFVRDRVKG